MLLAVISDTHGHVEYTRQAVSMLQSLAVDRVIHCGDIGSPDIPPLLAAWPVDYVLGNVDREVEALREAIEVIASRGRESFSANPATLGKQPRPKKTPDPFPALVQHRLHGRFGSLELEGRKIAFLHSDDERLFRETISSGEWDLVCYGHTHKPEVHREGATFVLNPGALYRAARHTIAVVELPQLEIRHVAL
jgi:predicted phosphodiesterase